MIEKELVERFVNAHKQAYDNWPYGTVTAVYVESGIVCVCYQDGVWYHYRNSEHGVEWW